METLNDHFAQIVGDRLKALDTNAFAVEQAHGLPPDSIRNVLRSEKKVGPSLTKAEEICRALGLEFYIGPRRPQHGAFRESGDPDRPAVLAPPTGYATFVWDNGDARGIPPVAFSHAWLRSHGLDYDRHTCVAVGSTPSDSAQPRNLAIIDRLARQTGGPTLWAVSDASRIVEVAEVQFESGLAVILPTPTAKTARLIRPTTVTPRLLGRVLWLGSVTTAPENPAP